ncbi:MAG: 5-(carboxyamino)imidazole ribonucleotide mutase, partial [Verrucomicrobia bacterium]|nr:5-(carboxyamino)imidazole ribonucleotide mutase [Verrucomicrobiota bacterium]
MKKPVVGVIMGSDSDLPTMQQAVDVLTAFGVAHEVRVVSAHRTPRDMARYAASAERRGLRVIIAGAGGAAHLPGMVASQTILPVIGVPIATKALQGLDSLLSIVQMPGGIPVATVAIGNGKNAGLLAVSILASAGEARLRKQLLAFRAQMARAS